MKKQLLKSALVAVVGVGFMAGSALAYPVPGASLQTVFDDITVGGPSSVDVTNDYLSDALDSYWSITASGGSFATLIVELAGFKDFNTFGVYDYNDPTKMVTLFNGPDSAGKKSTLSILDTGEVEVNLAPTGVFFQGNLFGYFLTTPEHNGYTYYSDTNLNLDGKDHMFAYQGTNTDMVKLPGAAAGLWTNNEYILAWEDLYNLGDKDFTDFVVMVESVGPNPVPEPTTMLLFGSGMLGLAAIARRRKSDKTC